jgi:sec-independent protein translocase protein TatA
VVLAWSLTVGKEIPGQDLKIEEIIAAAILAEGNMLGLGAQELMVILAIGLELFGSSKLPQLGGELGRAIRDFRKGIAGIDDERDKKSKKDESKALPQA